MPTADEFLSQYEPNQKANVSADEFLKNYQPEPNTATSRPSFFSAKTGLPTPQTPDINNEDLIKSGISAASRLPMLASDMGNAVVQGAARLGGAAYMGMGGDLSPEMAKTLTNLQPLYGSAETYKKIGIPVHEPEGISGVVGSFIGQGGGLAGMEKAGPVIAEKTVGALKTIPESVGRHTAGFNYMKPETLDAVGEQLSNNTSSAYKAFDDTGARLIDKSAMDLNNAVRKSYSDIKIDPVASPKTVSALKNIYDRIMKGKVDPITGEITQEPLSIGEVDQYRRQLARAQYGEDSAAATAARQAIDKHLNNLSESDFIGGNSNNAINLLNSARAIAAKEFKFNDLADIAKKAGGDPNKIKAAFTKFINNSDNLAGYTDAEKAALKAAGERGPAAAIERFLGTFGFDLGNTKNAALPMLIGENSLKGAAALAPHGLPLVGAGTIARQLSKLEARGGQQQAIDAILRRNTAPLERPPEPPSAPPPPVLALPAPETKIIGNSYGQNIPITPATRETLGQSPSTISEQTPAINAETNDYSQQGSSGTMQREMGNKRIMPYKNGNAGNVNLPVAAGISGAAASAGALLNKNQPAKITLTPQDKEQFPQVNLPVTGGIGEQNMQELRKLKPRLPPQSNALSQATDKFAKAESNNNPNAKNPNSSASGLYQFTNKTWADMVRKYGQQTDINLRDKNNPQAQSIMVKLLAQDNIKSLENTLGRLPTKGELYIAHVLGASGAAKLINAPANKEAIMLFPRQIFDANRNLFFQGKQPRTVAQVYHLLEQKVA